jgi:hypothetical protein
VLRQVRHQPLRWEAPHSFRSRWDTPQHALVDDPAKVEDQIWLGAPSMLLLGAEPKIFANARIRQRLRKRESTRIPHPQ